MLLSDREMTIRQKPSPFGAGFYPTSAPQAWWFCCAAISRHSKKLNTLCELCASSVAGGYVTSRSGAAEDAGEEGWFPSAGR
jgi:hypothetical protein